MFRKLDFFFDSLIKQAEQVYTNDEKIGLLIDQAFTAIGKLTEKYYLVQDQLIAITRMLSAWARREYTQMSPKTVISLIATLIYVVNPIDIIPDFIPFVGDLDDLFVLSYLANLLNAELQKFMAWERSKSAA